jgi:hypothetical protein
VNNNPDDNFEAALDAAADAGYNACLECGDWHPESEMQPWTDLDGTEGFLCKTCHQPYLDSAKAFKETVAAARAVGFPIELLTGEPWPVQLARFQDKARWTAWYNEHRTPPCYFK